MSDQTFVIRDAALMTKLAVAAKANEGTDTGLACAQAYDRIDALYDLLLRTLPLLKAVASGQTCTMAAGELHREVHNATLVESSGHQQSQDQKP